jgi:hypothetical protein
LWIFWVVKFGRAKGVCHSDPLAGGEESIEDYFQGVPAYQRAGFSAHTAPALSASQRTVSASPPNAFCLNYDFLRLTDDRISIAAIKSCNP